MDGNNFFYQIGAGFRGVVSEIFRGERQVGDYYGNSQFEIGNKSPIWLDPSNLWYVYTHLPHLNSIINKRAELLTMGIVRLREIDSLNIVKSHKALKLMSNPNPLQSTSEFFTQYLVYKDIYANAVTYKLSGLGSQQVPSVLWNLPPQTMKIIPTGKIFDQYKLEEIISSFEMTYAGQTKKFSPSEIIFKNDNIGSTYLKSQSRIVTHIKPLSNIFGALISANVLIYDRGAYGIISAASGKDVGGIMPLGDDERKRIEKQFLADYGPQRGKRTTILTNATLQYSPMSYPMRDMMLMEEVEQDFGILLDAYGVDRDCFASTKGATYENKEQGLLSTIQNTIIPEAKDICESFNRDFGLTDEGLELFFDFSHLPVIQNAKKKEKESEAIVTTTLHTQFSDGAIDLNEYRMALGKVAQTDDQRQQSQAQKIVNAQVELRGTVGGITGLVSINQSVAFGEMTREAAIAMVQNIYGFEPALADSMVTQFGTAKRPSNQNTQ